jgi:hypothetical protein
VLVMSLTALPTGTTAELQARRVPRPHTST